MSKKVVHVLGAMNAGGVEAWLMTLLRNTDKGLINHEFIVHHKEKAFYDDEIYSLGSQIHYCQYSANPFIYGINLYRTFKKIKPDVVHSHVHAFSGLVLLVAFLCGIKNRISHCHSDTRFKEKNSSLIRRYYISFMKILIKYYSTSCIAVSDLAAECLYGDQWKNNTKCSVIPCGIDINLYSVSHRKLSLRGELGIPSDAFVLGHVGRFSTPKNHHFLIDVFAEFRKKNDKAYLVLVGDGSLKAEIKEKVKELEVESYVIFTGLRNDVSLILLSVFDIFVFPSLWEGLPLSLVEAQYSKLNCLASDTITRECNLGGIIFLELKESIWIEALTNFKKSNFNIVDDKFSVYRNILSLSKIYGE